MNMVKRAIRKGGKMIVSYRIDGKEVDETTYKKTEKVEETTKKEIFMGNIYVTHRGTTKQYIDYKKACVDNWQAQMDRLIQKEENRGKNGFDRWKRVIAPRLVVMGETLGEKRISWNEYVLTVLFNETIYLIGFKKDYQRDLVCFVEKIN